MNNKRRCSAVWYCLISITVLLLSIPRAYAHPSSQKGILLATYVSGTNYNGYYIGGEDVGWSIDENYHTNGTVVTYSFSMGDPFLTDEHKARVRSGAAEWSGTVSIQEKADGTGTGLIKTAPFGTGPATAQFTDYRGHADQDGHLTSWTINLSRNFPPTTTAVAHEFGHVIGLNDLYADKNTNKLMYAFASGTATGPTSSDRWGAKVITGVHTSHTWKYKYNGTNSAGNFHMKYCVSCNGIASVSEKCTYNSSNVCIKCGIPYGVQPYSVGDDPLYAFSPNDQEDRKQGWQVP